MGFGTFYSYGLQSVDFKFVVFFMVMAVEQLMVISDHLYQIRYLVNKNKYLPRQWLVSPDNDKTVKQAGAELCQAQQA